MAEKQKPVVQLVGMDGNVFGLLAKCARALRRAGMAAEADALTQKVMKCGSYDEALQAMMEACDVE